MKNSLRNSLILLHFIVFIYGFTAILGKLITLDAIQIVWYRMLFAIVGLFIYLRFKKLDISISKKQIIKLLGIGIVVALHWITFFHAIKISNVSVTLGTLSSGTLFASILEPLFFRTKIKRLEVLIGVIIIAGLYLIFRYELQYVNGIIVALISTVLATTFTILNKSFTHKVAPSIISFYEMIGGFIGISLYIALKGNFNSQFFEVSTNDLVYLLILGIVCTAFAFAASVDVMKVVSAYTVVLSINMEPVYGIILAFLFFGDSEYMSSGFYLGTIIILLSVFCYPMYKKRIGQKA
ncbi:DMT family transporter [Saccharicrinis aurantiacus]|uniref:DMT family transporter n=1 Tax=Saccharicrinis aurantiacus TaxID=1849719 RepID=UPI002493357F|nr:DMT family transporter [Saccharicrinis aurantiacus]